MVRSKDLIDKLIADLHFHKYLFVKVGDNIFTEQSEEIENIQSNLAVLGLENKLNACSDFYHGGKVVTQAQIEHLNNFIDDVFIDYFFRTYNFKEIIFPKGLCYERITKSGIVYPQETISLNLNDIYDRCTFANNIFRLFGLDDSLYAYYPQNKFIKSFYINYKTYGLHSWCGTLINEKTIYEVPLDKFISKYYTRDSLAQTVFRGRSIKKFIDFLKTYNHDYLSGISTNYLFRITSFEQDYRELRNETIFGSYTIQEILLIYSLLVDKFLLEEDSFLLSLCNCFCEDIKDSVILNDFIVFEEQNLDYKNIEQFIRSKDMYLRFASHTTSKAFSFNPINEIFDQIYLFGKKSNIILKHSNSLPLPFLYNLTLQ